MPRILLALPLLLAAALPAAAQITASGGTPVTEAPRLLDAGEPARIADLIRAAGYRAVLDTTDRGNPVIDSSAEGANFSIYLIECENGADCWAVHYVSSFTLTEDADLAVLNDWNTRRTIGQAGLLDARTVQIAHYQDPAPRGERAEFSVHVRPVAGRAARLHGAYRLSPLRRPGGSRK